MSFIGRVFVIFFAFLIASMAAGMTIALGLLAMQSQALQNDPVAQGAFWVMTFFGTSFAGATSFLPLLLVIVLAESFNIRSVIFYALAGIAIMLLAYYGMGFGNWLEESIDQAGPLSPQAELTIAAGAVFGLAYWLVAGRRAGAWRASAR
jgi:hypothetical protein